MSIAFPIVSWANGTNIYEVNVRQYTEEGTFQSFMKHIPRLADMGIEILWLMPVTPISVEKRQGTYGSYYAASSYTDIDPAYGTGNDMKELVALAHQHGMKVIIDWVANHTGYDHQWTKKNAEWYRKDESGNFTEIYGWIDVIDLNYDVPEMRQEMIRSMKFWMTEYDLDGFRCDMARTVPIDFWLEARAECDTVKPLFWLAECEIIAYHEVFDVTYGWLAMRAMDKYMKNEELPLSDIIAILHDYAKYPVGSETLLFTSNHDENTDHGTEFEKYGHAVQAMAAFTCTYPGIPLIYSGQEKPNRRRLPFFEKDHINWDGDVEYHDFYKALLTLRKKNHALQENASVLLLEAHDKNVLAYLCRRNDDKVLFIANFGKDKTSFEINHPAIKGEYENLFVNDRVTFTRSQNFEFESGQFIVYHYTKADYCDESAYRSI